MPDISYYEILSIALGCVAVVMSFATWSGQRKLQREANDLQRATSELAKKQLEILVREEKGKNSARLLLKLVRDGKSYRFILSNVSDVDAANIQIEPILQRPEDDPLIASEYAEKFPVKRLPPGSEVRLIAAIALSSPSAFNFRVSWNNPDGTKVSEENFVSL